MEKIKLIVNECQSRVIYDITETLWADDDHENTKTLAYVAGANALAREILNKLNLLGGHYEENRIPEMEIDLSEAEACLREQQGCN